MKLTSTIAVIGLLALLVACGGGDKQMQSAPTGPVIDPSGNWSMTARDPQGKEIKLAALFNQVGVVVTANSFTAEGNLSPFNCVPFSATFANGLVNGNTFSGQIAITHAANFPSDMTSVTESFNFAATLTPNGEGISSGTYSNMPACSSIAPSGSFTGGQIPSVTGTWSGTIQPCDFSQQTGDCALKGSASPYSTVLTQNDATGLVTGSYQAANVPELSSGTIGAPPNSSFMLSGTTFQFELTDANGSSLVGVGGLNGPSSGGLGFDRSFTGLIFLRPNGPGSPTFRLVMSH